jgi:hypothetical protein
MPKIEIIDYGPFEIEVGSPTYIRLLEQEKIRDDLPVRQLEVDGETGDDERAALEALNKPQLVEHAEGLGVDAKGLTKAQLVDAIAAAGEPASDPDTETL